MMRAKTAVDIHELFAQRRSPRSLDETATMSHEDVIGILEAARWAPSANNVQPWRFVVGLRGDDEFVKILSYLVPFNQAWAFRASILVAVGGEAFREDGNANPTFMYDCGLAVAQLTLEAHHRGFVAHQMAGFDAEKAAELFEGQKPIVIVAIGKQAPADQLEGPAFDRENAARERKDLAEIVLRGLPL
jgi:nitroreductase